ncbi:hypothetical protein [Bailinhaonella thermotolerans]|uniref:hypothetical protein n=1 Tax=Bailinhaonella thermotolerans TaxID=1070861 RepID=UPI00192A1CCA|nr:hypothetical protein [Bailinhaonella thermotolerans]
MRKRTCAMILKAIAGIMAAGLVAVAIAVGTVSDDSPAGPAPVPAVHLVKRAAHHP